jgi:hypothetical protein
MLRKFALCLAVLLAPQLPAQDAVSDVEGCKDSTLLSRLPGCSIQSCERKEFDRTGIRTGAFNSNNDAVKTLEGEVELISFVMQRQIVPAAGDSQPGGRATESPLPAELQWSGRKRLSGCQRTQR